MASEVGLKLDRGWSPREVYPSILARVIIIEARIISSSGPIIKR